MSVIQQILQDLADHLQEADSYFDEEFYFDTSQATASLNFPCFCYQVIQTNEDYASGSLNPDCREYVKLVQLSCLTDTTNPDTLIKELWDFEEKLITTLRGVIPQDINPNLMELNFTRSSALDSLWSIPDNENDSEFLCNELFAVYELKYVI